MTSGLRGNDPGEWGHSLANMQELLVAVLDAARVRSVTEIGAYAGDLTRDLADWVEERDGEVIAVDPFPQPELVRLAEERASVSLIEQPSFEALGHIPRTDAVVIDGDHNYYTVSRELGAIGERFPDEELPVLILHDVRWPHSRRDAYYAPDSIPEEERQPISSGAIFPGVSGIAQGGLPFRDVAAEEGGPRNGVLTALDDFLEGRGDLRLGIVPAFYGVGIAWPAAAPWSDDLTRVLEPWDRTPWLERLEQHRAYNLARYYEVLGSLQALHGSLQAIRGSLQAEIDRLSALNEHKIEMLEQLGDSRAFKLADRISQLRRRNGRAWREQLQGLIRER